MFERMKNPFGQSNFNSGSMFVYAIKIRVLKLKNLQTVCYYVLVSFENKSNKS